MTLFQALGFSKKIVVVVMSLSRFLYTHCHLNNKRSLRNDNRDVALELGDVSRFPT